MALRSDVYGLRLRSLRVAEKVADFKRNVYICRKYMYNNLKAVHVHEETYRHWIDVRFWLSVFLT